MNKRIKKKVEKRNKPSEGMELYVNLCDMWEEVTALPWIEELLTELEEKKDEAV